MQRQHGFAGALPLAFLLPVFAASTPALAGDFAPATQLRRPVALALSAEDHWLFVANRQSGTVSVVDAVLWRVVDEVQVARKLSDLAVTPDGRFVLATDEEGHALVVLRHVAGVLEVAERIPVSPYPVSVTVAPDGRSCYVASQWSRRMSIVRLGPTGQGQVASVLDLPFAPREQLLIQEGRRLIVADAFGGQLAIVDTQSGLVENVRELPGHNIRGLSLDKTGEKLLVAHPILNGLAETTHNDVHWGILMTNVLRWLKLENVLSPDTPILAGSHVHPAGDSNGAGGDPAAVTVVPDGRVLWALSGVGELAFGHETDYTLKRVPVGRGPTAVVASRDGKWAWVANRFSDSVTVIDLEAGAARGEVSLGPQPPLTPAEEGEVLFHDARLSLDSWFSCASCHTEGHTNGLLADNLGDGSFGAAKRVPTLLGAAGTRPWAWDGHFTDLDEQIRSSVVTTMRGEPPTDEQVAALTAYLSSLAPPPPLGPLVGDDPAAAERGRAVFDRQGCATCHAGEEFTSPAVYDVGLADQAGNRQFNPPSLRGVSQGGPYLHDNRAATLEDLFARHRHQVPDGLSAEDLRDLVVYLRSL